MTQNPTPAPERHRLTLDLSPQVAKVLEHVSEVSGLTRSQIAAQALIEALPGLLERSDAFQKRSRELTQAVQNHTQKKR